MTRPFPPSLLAPESVTVDMLRAEERSWTEKLKAHRCIRCEFGGRCRTFDYLADNADAAGWRWAEAERRHKEVGA